MDGLFIYFRERERESDEINMLHPKLFHLLLMFSRDGGASKIQLEDSEERHPANEPVRVVSRH